MMTVMLFLFVDHVLALPRALSYGGAPAVPFVFRIDAGGGDPVSPWASRNMQATGILRALP
jgi:hypothetical protein